MSGWQKHWLSLLVLLGAFLFPVYGFCEGASLRDKPGLRVEMSLDPASYGLLDNGFPSDIYNRSGSILIDRQQWGSRWDQWW